MICSRDNVACNMTCSRDSVVYDIICSRDYVPGTRQDCSFHTVKYHNQQLSFYYKDYDYKNIRSVQKVQ